MQEKLNLWLEEHLDEMVGILQKLVAHPSVVDKPCGPYPYGEPVARCLEETLAIAESMGMQTKNVGYHAGTIQLDGREPKLGILAHLDVVPAGNGWDTPPFELTVKDGKVYGRGAIDDKGPAVATLFAMRGIKELGIPLKDGVRLIVGCSEEVGGPDMAEYQKQEAFPPLLFTPDANFPLINIEKGRLPTALTVPSPADARFLSLNAGSVINAVPDIARAELTGCESRAVLDLAASLDLKGVRWSAVGGDNPGRILITCRGKAAHASTPDDGYNTLTAMFALLAALDIQPFDTLSALFPYGDNRGEAAGLACEDEVSGKMTLVPTVCRTEGGVLTVQCDCRFPVCETVAGLSAKFAGVFEPAGLACAFDGVEPHYVDSKSEFVQTLLRVYEAHTGCKGDCIAIGGGTYVHDTENGVAFGPEFEGEEYNLHGPNENMPLATLLKCAQIYAHAIVELCGK